MHPQQVGSFDLDRAEAVEDGTALVGQLNPEKTSTQDGRTVRRPSPEEIGQDWHRIGGLLAGLFTAGVPDNDQRAQQAIHEHYQWICHFWVPDRDSYLRLANLYATQPKFRRRIERKKPAGLAAYMRDVMTAYAWARLR